MDQSEEYSQSDSDDDVYMSLEYGAYVKYSNTNINVGNLNYTSPGIITLGGNTMPANIRKIILKKKFDNVVYDILPKTSADIVSYVPTAGGDETSVRYELDKLQGLTAATVQGSITRAKEEILGIFGAEGDNRNIAQAFDTIKEIADYLGSPDNELASSFISNVATLKDYVLDGWTDNDTPVAGLLTRVANIESTVEDKTTFTTDMVPEGTTYDRKYVTAAEKARIGSTANVVYYADETAFGSATTNNSDLYFVGISSIADPGASEEPSGE